MRTAIGAGYFMIHETNGKIKYWYISDAENKKYANIDSCKFTAYYGGKSGKGKRIDIEFSNNYYDFKMNIRNKQSGVYPSHIMMDYTSQRSNVNTYVNMRVTRSVAHWRLAALSFLQHHHCQECYLLQGYWKQQ